MRQISCQLFCHRRIYADSRRHRHRVKLGFLRGFLKLEHGAPSHDTFSRLFRLLDPEQFRHCFQQFMARFAETCQGVVAIDGKVLRRSFDKTSGKSALAHGVRLGLRATHGVGPGCHRCQVE
jgi:hypothetical protein